MSSPIARRSMLALSLAALSLTGCRSGIDTQAKPRHAANGFAASETPRETDACGTYERPCVLPELRVTASRGE